MLSQKPRVYLVQAPLRLALHAALCAMLTVALVLALLELGHNLGALQ